MDQKEKNGCSITFREEEIKYHFVVIAIFGECRRELDN